MIAMWVVGSLGVILMVFVASRKFLCKTCRGDGYISEAKILLMKGQTAEHMDGLDQVCPLCDGGKWMKYERCPRCIGRGVIHHSNTKDKPCPVCKGSGRVKLGAGAWLRVSLQAVMTIVLLLASGGIVGLLLGGVWDFLIQFAIAIGFIG